MSDNERQDHRDDASPDRGVAFASRRRVIKGLASAVPAILTVSSGAALAAGSAIQCINHQPPPPDDACIQGTIGTPASLPPGDDWLRAYERDSFGTGYVDVNSDRTDADDLDGGDNDLCLVYVDQNGGRVSADAGGTPLSTSCYNSFT